MDDWKLKAQVVVEIETESIMFVSFEFNLVIYVLIFSTFLTTQTTNAAARATLAVLIMAILTVD